MANIISVDLVFENVESITVTKYHALSWKNLTVSYHEDAIGQRFGVIAVDAAMISFDVKDCQSNLFDKDEDILHRLSSNDISHFDINYDDGSNIYIGVPWSPEDEYTNLFQKTTIHGNNVRIEFKEGKTIS